MTKREAERYARLRMVALDRLKLTSDDFESLLRIERTLQRWGERECNGEVETEESGKAYGYSLDRSLRWRVPNREAGAQRRLAAIMARYPELGAYVQGDPRGCALYVYERSKLEAGRNIDSHYSSVGVAFCY